MSIVFIVKTTIHFVPFFQFILSTIIPGDMFPHISIKSEVNAEISSSQMNHCASHESRSHVFICIAPEVICSCGIEKDVQHNGDAIEQCLNQNMWHFSFSKNFLMTRMNFSQKVQKFVICKCCNKWIMIKAFMFEFEEPNKSNLLCFILIHYETPLCPKSNIEMLTE